jgi:hypothetical protein
VLIEYFTVFPFFNLYPSEPIAFIIAIKVSNLMNLLSDISFVPVGNDTLCPPTFTVLLKKLKKVLKELNKVLIIFSLLPSHIKKFENFNKGNSKL